MPIYKKNTTEINRTEHGGYKIMWIICSYMFDLDCSIAMGSVRPKGFRTYCFNQARCLIKANR